MQTLIPSQSAIDTFLSDEGNDSHPKQRERATVTIDGYRVVPTLPAGSAIGKTYFHAVLKAAGMLSTHRAGAPDMAILGSYDTATPIKHHEGAKNLQRVKGGYRLTSKGLTAMTDRKAKAKKSKGYDESTIDQIVAFLNGETKGAIPDCIKNAYPDRRAFETTYKRFKK